MLDRLLSAVTRCALRVLLRLYPREIRDRFGDAIHHDLNDELAAAADRRELTITALRALTDTAAGVLPEHRRTWRRGMTHGGPMFQGIAADVRLAVRRLLAQPTTSAVIVCTFALAIGASTAIFSVVDAVVLQPLPFPDSSRLVRLTEEADGGGVKGASLPAIELWSEAAGSLDGLTFYQPHTATVVLHDEAERLAGAIASRNYFDVFGVRPALGHTFTPGTLVGPPDEVVISHRLWMRLGGNPEVIGSTLVVDPRSYRVVGVMPPGFAYPDGADFWTSPPADMQMLRTTRDVRFLSVVGRLKAKATLDTLRAELAVLTEQHPSRDRIGGPVRMTAIGLQDWIVGSSRRGLAVVGASAVLLLLIACANIAALMLARSITRRQQMAVEAALGASSGRLARQAALEVLVVAVPAGLLGLAAAWLCRDAIVRLSLEEIPRIASVAIDLRALLFAGAATMAAAALTTVLPAWLASRTDAAQGLRQGRGSRHSGRTLSVLRTLAATEVALTFVLLVSGLLLVRTVDGLRRVDRGFDAGTEVLAARLHLPLRPRLAPEAQLAFYRDVLEGVGALPHVEAAAFASRIPLSAAPAITETHALDNPTHQVRAILNSAGPNYFRIIGTPILEGTDFPDSPAVPSVVVNAILARQLFGEGSPLGRRLSVRYMTGPVEAVVVGVSSPVRYNGLAGPAEPEVYLDYRARTPPLFLVARVRGDLAAVLPAVKAVVARLDPTGRVTVAEATTLDREIARQLARPWFFLALVGTFGSVALLLAAGGLYGVLSFTVAQRRHELGVRLALGASARDLFRHVVGSGGLLTGIGLAAGVLMAAASVRLLQSLLFGVAPLDPIAFAASGALVIALAFIACWLPARRAGRTDPLTVLRE